VVLFSVAVVALLIKSNEWCSERGGDEGRRVILRQPRNLSLAGEVTREYKRLPRIWGVEALFFVTVDALLMNCEMNAVLKEVETRAGE